METFKMIVTTIINFWSILRLSDCVAHGIRSIVPQPTEWQRIGNQIDAAMVFARADFYSRAMQKNVAKQFGPV